MSDAKKGLKRTKTAIEKGAEKLRGRPQSEEHKRKRALSLIGKKRTEVALNNMKKQVICPYCGIIGQHSNMKRWHFNNCRLEKVI